MEDELAELARSVRRFVEVHGEQAHAAERTGGLSREAWTALAELGVLGLGDPSDGGVSPMAAALTVLGAASFPGPLVPSSVAARLLDDEQRGALERGELMAAVGTPPLVAWAPVADVFVIVDGGRARLARATSPIEAVTSLGGEPWGRVSLEVTRELGDATAACAVGDVALAAYLCGAGSELLRVTAQHARTRKQFGRAIGEFQAVSHPLANVAVRLRSARALIDSAATALDSGDADAVSLAASARRSAVRATMVAAEVAPQTFGALGVLVEGPVFGLARRIRQWASPSLAERTRVTEAVLAPYSAVVKEQP